MGKERKEKIEMSLVTIIIAICFYMIVYNFISIDEGNYYIAFNK